MLNRVDSIRLCRCFEANRIDLVRYLPDPGTESGNRASQLESEHFPPLRPEAHCLQRWLDLNA